jgi:hypothetical protein
VKTAISIPERAFERVRRHAERLGMSRSEFFTKAAERWADDLEAADVTAAINDALAAYDDDDNDAFLRQAAADVLARQRR